MMQIKIDSIISLVDQISYLQHTGTQGDRIQITKYIYSLAIKLVHQIEPALVITFEEAPP